MNKIVWFRSMVLASCAAFVLCIGCSKQEASTAFKNAEESARDAAETVAADVGDAAKEGQEMAGDALEGGKQAASDAVKKGADLASDLGEKAMAFVAPLKEKVGNLDNLKEKPEELKVAVEDLIQSMEQKAEGMELPESVSNALATIKEKLVALKDYLEGEVEQAQVNERVQDIMDSVKSGLGMTSK